MTPPRATLLIILDGCGIAEPGPGNAVSQACMTVLTQAMDSHPFTILSSSGSDVGLPDGQMGNSEVGHLNIGAGRVVYQNIVRIDRSIEDGSFFRNPVLTACLEHVRTNSGALHLWGLVSPGGVHSHTRHLSALLRAAGASGTSRVYVHVVLDGRDTPPRSGLGYVEDLLRDMHETGAGEPATVCGRFFAMDRDSRWERVEQAFRAMVHGEGERAEDIRTAVENAYQAGETDEFVSPRILYTRSGIYGGIEPGDGVILFNFRADRAREMAQALTKPIFSAFDRGRLPDRVFVAGMTEYDQSLSLPVLFPPQTLSGILGEVVAQQGLAQARIAETEKYAHVTSFFNGGRETPFAGEERVLVPSPRDVATYDLKPGMNAVGVTDAAIGALAEERFSLIVVNYANPDMVGHTGNIPATREACRIVDDNLGRLLQAARRSGVRTFITADHGNAEDMLDETGVKPKTAHSTHPVPFVWIEPDGGQGKLRNGGALCDIAPTILDLWGMPCPEQMTGKSLVDRS